MFAIQLGAGIVFEDVHEGTYHEHCWAIQEVGQNLRHVFAAKNSAQKQHWHHLVKDGLDLERDSATGMFLFVLLCVELKCFVYK